MNESCQRCGRKPGKGATLKWLTLESEEKSTTIYLCDICMGAARKIWNNFMAAYRSKQNGT